MRHSSLALLVACAISTSMTHATTITFEGKITDQTCSVTVNGQNDLTIKLPTVHTGVFNSTSPAAGTTPFKVAITGCKPASDEAEKYKVTFKSNHLAGAGYLANTDTAGAKNVAVQLSKNEDGSDGLDLSDQAKSVIELTVPAKGDGTSHMMAAQYIMISDAQPVEPGKVLATVEYKLDYL